MLLSHGPVCSRHISVALLLLEYRGPPFWSSPEGNCLGALALYCCIIRGLLGRRLWDGHRERKNGAGWVKPAGLGTSCSSLEEGMGGLVGKLCTYQCWFWAPGLMTVYLGIRNGSIALSSDLSTVSCRGRVERTGALSESCSGP
ncbi:hypothetical protein N658DRAFT_2982 [Parathielavia hyrcaniae]|uniref:Uncharacterized protein n=1 Tax=Parathielavia hyrcaniae TaxID=113614 RepID=A0AAN6Q985_9PEZI|nr:hypothetical protein N658DRAFT_2982 [Parathielavia hyrcaniae]